MPEPHPITTAEQTGWERRAAALLVRLLDLAAKEHLPAVTWTVGEAGATLRGEALGDRATRRERHAAWLRALTAASGLEPDHSHEHTFGSGETRLLAGWEHLPARLTAGRYPSVNVVLTASLWEDEGDADDG